MKNIRNQFDEVTSEQEVTEATVPASSIALDMDKYKTKKEKEKDTKTRVSLFLEPALAKRLDKAAKRYGKGFKSSFTSDVLEKALDALEAKENSK
ncbi:hypothetical protein [Exiguobacterium acetylicum]|uniref:hypothetical protein n=1 Tax=Exiguobacterium acetylicum TaxID=41170 RepID=UPI001CA6EEAB|nr:hypothetical protein [Exiguobacterium acetylicum]QZY88552.1 hypothetical protein K7G97_16580 [Exiguobacterium acetylicum]